MGDRDIVVYFFKFILYIFRKYLHTLNFFIFLKVKFSGDEIRFLFINSINEQVLTQISKKNAP